ncbi:MULTISPECIES: pentapeptide repeat-containing protein [Spirulina sp. CCY15215]|uniref:pentapeptide repeat-containing protein n=1 Tax=Spirulina sp. CCY15215 TaxID=2767591 RepID=UPI0019529193|nr:pentapeptide repeat-containing protein [Spirulina major]
MTLSLRQWLADRQIPLEQLLSSGVSIAAVAFRIARDMEVKSLNPFALCSLADVLELPLLGSLLTARPIARLTIELLYLLQQKKPLKRSEATWLAFQVAYLNALEVLLEQESRANRAWLQRAKISLGETANAPLSDPTLQGLLKTLRPGKLSESQAEQALSTLAESFLVKQMNRVCGAWFLVNGASDREVAFLIHRLTRSLPGHLLMVVAENAAVLSPLHSFVGLSRPRQVSHEKNGRSNADEVAHKPHKIDAQREHYRAQLSTTLNEPLFGELFSLPDIYVPPQGIVAREGVSSQEETSLDLETWANAQLKDRQTIAVIESPTGGGKTSFCRIWAAKLAREVYPNWLPVIVPLQFARLGRTLWETLDSAFPLGRFQAWDGWLSPNAPPCLLILDGLDKLPRSPRRIWQVRAFLEQLLTFHLRVLHGQEPIRHKIVLATSSMVLEDTIRSDRLGNLFPLQSHLQRIRIAPFEREALKQWFKQWSKLQSQSISYRYFRCLKEKGLFHQRPEILENAKLVHSPLTLFLLGLLHRDGNLSADLFEKKLPRARFEMYEGLLAATRYQETEESREIQSSAFNLQPLAFNLNLLEELALKLLQTGNRALSIVTEKNEPEEPELDIYSLFSSLHPLFFSLNESQSAITFSHDSVGDYLTASALAKLLRMLTQKQYDRYGEETPLLDSPQAIAEHLYTWLGYGVLSRSIETLIIECLFREQKQHRRNFSFSLLFDRLYLFYQSFCQGRWLDEGLPQQTRERLQTVANPLNVNQIDAAVGLNVFLLLRAIAQRISLPFYPCGKPDYPETFEADRLWRAIVRIEALSPNYFWTRGNLQGGQLIGGYLSGAVLCEVNLSQANLTLADLSRANLTRANLSGANLSRATLADANLSHCNLSQANLEEADLSGANLKGANLTGTNLHKACLSGVELDKLQSQQAKENQAFFSRQEFHDYSQTLTSELLANEMGYPELANSDAEIKIESAEGQPLLPSEWNEPRAADIGMSPHAPTLADPQPKVPYVGNEDNTLAAPENSLMNIGSEDDTVIAGDYPPTANSSDDTIQEPEAPSVDLSLLDELLDGANDDETIAL